MRRTICLLAAICLFLSGCGFFGERIKEPVTFYYLCDKYQEELCCVIVSEEREASGHVGDLSYLLHLYLMGPSDDELVSPLPGSVRILSVEKDGSHIRLELTDAAQNLSDISFSLACACLTMTCLDISGAENVTIQSGDRSITMNRESLALYDNSAETTPTEDTK